MIHETLQAIRNGNVNLVKNISKPQLFSLSIWISLYMRVNYSNLMCAYAHFQVLILDAEMFFLQTSVVANRREVHLHEMKMK